MRDFAELGLQFGDRHVCRPCCASGRQSTLPPIAAAPSVAGSADFDERFEQEVLDAVRDGVATRLGVRARGEEWAIVWVQKRAARMGLVLLSVFLVFLYWGFLESRMRAEFELVDFVMVLVPAAMCLAIALFKAFPGERLVADRVRSSLEWQHAWLGIPYSIRRLASEDIAELVIRSVGVMVSESTTHHPRSAEALTIAGVAMASGSASEPRPHREGIHALEVRLRDGSSTRLLFALSEEDCRLAVDAIGRVLHPRTGA